MKADYKPKQLDITVLMGGPSSEREISLLSGAAVADALEKAGHKVTRADITPTDTSALDRAEADLFFIALHGDFGESGEVQDLCQARGLMYTGSGPMASKLGMDKVASKQIFKRAGLTTADWLIVEQYDKPCEVKQKLMGFAMPCVVKPVSGGSSVDVFICNDQAEVDKAVEQVVDTYDRAMVEEFVKGREVTVGILGKQALPMIEIRPKHGWYDHHAKYADGSGTEYVFDHGIADEVVQLCQQQAVTAFESLECRDLARVDFIIDENNVPQVLEINTIPGFTSHSLLPMAAGKTGVSFVELVDKVAWMAMDRAQPDKVDIKVEV